MPRAETSTLDPAKVTDSCAVNNKLVRCVASVQYCCIVLTNYSEYKCQQLTKSDNEKNDSWLLFKPDFIANLQENNKSTSTILHQDIYVPTLS